MSAFLEQVCLVADADQIPDPDDSGGVVTLMTLHSAKGLEFPVVFLVGLEDGVFPHLRTLGDVKELQEERRLAYVGHHPGPAAAAPEPRGRAQRLGPDVLQPAVAVPRGGADGAGRVGRRLGDRLRRPGRGAPAHEPAIAQLARKPGVRSLRHPCRGALESGDRVTHDTFGLGTVVETKGAGDAAQARIDFGAAGTQVAAAALRPGREALSRPAQSRTPCSRSQGAGSTFVVAAADLEVQVRAGGTALGADLGDRLPCRHLSLADEDRRHVPVGGGDAVGVTDHDEPAVAAGAARRR